MDNCIIDCNWNKKPVIGQLYFNYSSITILFVSSNIVLKLIILSFFFFYNSNGGRCIHTKNF